jgi:hypothetical protein
MNEAKRKRAILKIQTVTMSYLTPFRRVNLAHNGILDSSVDDPVLPNRTTESRATTRHHYILYSILASTLEEARESKNQRLARLRILVALNGRSGHPSMQFSTSFLVQ